MRTLAILLTVHNRKATTLRCLAQLFEQHIPPDIVFDVWITDDGCTDGTREAIESNFPSVHIVLGDGNLYWNRGMQKAWVAAANFKSYDFYLWLNDDTFLFDNAISHLLSISATNKDKAITVGYTLDTTKSKITYGGRNKKLQLITEVTGVTPCTTFNGNIVLFPRYVYEHVGTNDPFFHHAIGDTDYGLRALKTGIKSYIAPQASGICDTHTKLPIWANPSYPLIQRFKALYKPGGNGSNPVEFFVLNFRHRGLLLACIKFISNHIHALLPSLWKRPASKY